MEKDKQERMVCHLELLTTPEHEHYYFGNLKVLTDNFPKEEIGVAYKSLANYFTNHSEYRNDNCIVRKAAIITSKRTTKE